MVVCRGMVVDGEGWSFGRLGKWCLVRGTVIGWEGLFEGVVVQWVKGVVLGLGDKRKIVEQR